MKELKQRIHENGIDYVLVGDYYVPVIKLPEEERPIGKWGRMHQAHLLLPCRPERTGAGPLPVHRPVDDGGRGRDRGHEAAVADGVGAGHEQHRQLRRGNR